MALARYRQAILPCKGDYFHNFQDLSNSSRPACGRIATVRFFPLGTFPLDFLKKDRERRLLLPRRSWPLAIDRSNTKGSFPLLPPRRVGFLPVLGRPTFQTCCVPVRQWLLTLLAHSYAVHP